MERWYPYFRLPISIEQFHTLPRNSAYRYEFFDGVAHLSARPKCYHCGIEIDALAKPELVPLDWKASPGVRAFAESDWPLLPEPFSHAMHAMLPFAALDDEKRLEASLDCLQQVRDGKEGPLIPEACFVAVDENDGHILGGALVTLWQLNEFDFAEWQVETLPHLTWIFVLPMLQRHGIGSLLLWHVLAALRAQGYPRLASTFLLGNDASAMWHWRHGFQLAGYMMSPRAWKRDRKRRTSE
jgi:GNAT superfamily N-acetyltransferase